MIRWGKPTKNKKKNRSKYFINESMELEMPMGGGLEEEILNIVGSQAEAGMGVSLENIVNNIDADPEAVMSAVEAMAASGALYAEGESYFLGDASAPTPSEDLDAIMEAKWKTFIGK